MDEKILSELKRMSRLLALALVKEMKSSEKYKILHDYGYSPKEIAEMLNTTSNTVSVEINKLKKKIRRNKK